MPWGDDIDALTAHTESGFVQQRGRERGGEPARYNQGAALVDVRKCARQRLVYVVGIHPFIADVDVGFVVLREVVIDLNVDLLAVACGFAAAEKIVGTAEGSQVAITRRIQSV